MKISIAKTAGFCMGVRRAVDMVLDAANLSDEPVYTYGPLIHNPQVLEMLEKKGIHRLDEIPETGSGIVLVRAHGVPPQDEAALKTAGFEVINATCPRVVRVQVIIDKYAKKGFSTIIIGDEKHPEVVGLLGYARGKGHTVTSIDQLKTLPPFENAVVVAQTTQNTAFYSEIKSWCKTHAPHYKIFDTICGSTERRQNEIRTLAGQSDAVVVIGGKESGNTRRLAQIASETGKPASHIEAVSELDFDALSSAKTIAITAGASTPNWIIKDTCRQIDSRLKKKSPVRKTLYALYDFLTQTNILTAGGAGSLTYACSKLQGVANHLHHAMIAMLYVLSMQILNNLFTIKSDTYNHPERALFYEKNRWYLVALAILSGGAGLYMSLASGMVSFILLLMMSVLGLSYNLKVFPFLGKKGKWGRIRDISGSKTFLITIAWGTVTCLLPAMGNQTRVLPVAVVFVFACGLVFAKTALVDSLAVQGDRITGRETLPILLGEKKTIRMIKGVLVVSALVLGAAFFADLLVKRAFLLAFMPVFMLLLISYFEKDSSISGSRREFVVELLFLVSGCLTTL